MAEVLLLLGGDQGDVQVAFARAEVAIRTRCGIVLGRSRDHWTAPWGFAGTDLFLNRAILVATHLGPEDLMRELLGIERELGRVREPGAPVGSRPIDIDVLLWGDACIDRPGIQVPHPRMHLRAFALAPAADLLPTAIHPVQGRALLHLLDGLPR